MDSQGVGMSIAANVQSSEPLVQARGLVKRYGRSWVRQVWGRAVALCRYQSYDFARQPTILYDERAKLPAVEWLRRCRTMRQPRKPVPPNTVTVRSLVATVVQVRQFVSELLTICGRGIGAIQQLVDLARRDEVVLVRS